GDDLRAPRHGPPHHRGDPVPRLSRGADQRHAGGGRRGDAEPGRRSHVCGARSAHPVPLRSVMAIARTATFTGQPAPDAVRRLHARADAWGRKPLGAVSAGLIVLLALSAIFADVVAPYDPIAAQPEIRLSAPSRAHPFGTDDIGRDVLSRVIHGARISL